MAQGFIVSKDPEKEVAGKKLGFHFWEVYIEKVLEPNEPLARPYQVINTVGEALGITVPWNSFDV